jgi:hypothetical protein
MLTQDILFGMNILTLVGLIMTGFGLTLRRSANAGVPLCIGVMGVRTVLVLAGLYASWSPHCNSQVLVHSVRAGAIGVAVHDESFSAPAEHRRLRQDQTAIPSASIGGSACRRS